MFPVTVAKILKTYKRTNIYILFIFYIYIRVKNTYQLYNRHK